MSQQIITHEELIIQRTGVGVRAKAIEGCAMV